MQSRSSSSSQATDHSYSGSLAEVKQTVFTGQGNMFGFEIENNDPNTDVFLQVFDALAASVTVGVTAPTFTFRVPAGGNFGCSPQDLVLHWFSIGCVIACTATRTGAGAPAAPSSINIWSWNK